MSKLNEPITSRKAKTDIAMATSPKSSGTSKRARISILTTPMPRSTSRIRIIQAAPFAMRRPRSVGIVIMLAIERAMCPRVESVLALARRYGGEFTHDERLHVGVEIRMHRQIQHPPRQLLRHWICLIIRVADVRGLPMNRPWIMNRSRDALCRKAFHHMIAIVDEHAVL